MGELENALNEVSACVFVFENVCLCLNCFLIYILCPVALGFDKLFLPREKKKKKVAIKPKRSN